MTTFLDIVLRKECFNDWKLYKAVPSNLLLKTLKPKCIVSISLTPITSDETGTEVTRLRYPAYFPCREIIVK